MGRKISEERKTAYYFGMVLMIIGGLLFASTFLTAVMDIGDFPDFDEFDAHAKSAAIRAFGGMALLIIGGIIRGVGARGLAGSGVVLDPEQARQDLEPYTRMAGGMVKDALDEAEITIGPSRPEKVVMIKCPACGKLNEEDSKFCQECAAKL